MMARIRSSGKCDVGKARKLRIWRLRSIGEDHLNGVCWSVRVWRFGRETGAEIEDALGNHGHSAKKPASILETSNSLSRGASPIWGIKCQSLIRKGMENGPVIDFRAPMEANCLSNRNTNLSHRCICSTR